MCTLRQFYLQVLSTTVRVTSCLITNLCTIQFAMILDTKVVELQATNQGGMQTAQGDDETKVAQGDDIDMPSSTPLNSSPRQQLLGTIHIELRSTYLQRLHNMLEHCPANLASWTTDGTSFAIYDPHALEMHVLPQFFMTTKFTSFLRQLSLYRFKKTHYTASNGVMALRFQHKQFTRNDPNAVVAMVRRYRARPSQSKAQEHNAVSREELKAILIGLLESVHISDFLRDGLFEYASSDDSANQLHASSASLSPPPPRSSRSSSVDGHDDDEKSASYLQKLYAMLNECPLSVASWTCNGTAFAIYDPESLEKVIIPQHFQPIKFESFVRQLNSYRFKKSKLVCPDTSTVLQFQHSSFVRGRPELLESIKRRRRVRRTGPKSVQDMNDVELRTAMTDLVKFVQTLHTELDETKALAASLAAKKAT
ncbi:hypothetical protein DYB37_004256 [Aphanomyces astaci]|uniref:HSF-type DNA-binding domain-containing protein n=1 Tax=Aphanomyces astaci TaxID=112090 RepID=A0A418ESM8_APHAT|nr:hypothetical protein DYB37_004256 [Aphanomyces astaci]